MASFGGVGGPSRTTEVHLARSLDQFLLPQIHDSKWHETPLLRDPQGQVFCLEVSNR